jgi:dipeptidyl aminopeptidase/acylaminoacyl peptidase
LLKHISLFFVVFIFLIRIPTSAQQSLSISPEAFGALAEIYSVKISPGGNRLLTLEKRNGEIVLITRSLNDQQANENIIPFESGQYNWAEWVSDDLIIASYRYVGHADRDTSLRLQVQRRLLTIVWDGSEVFNPHRFRRTNRFAGSVGQRQPQVQDVIIDMLKDDPEHVLIQMDVDKATEPAVYKLNVRTKKRTRVLQSRRIIDFWMTDQDHVVRYGEGTSVQGRKDEVRNVAQYRKSIKDRWVTLFDYDEIKDDRPFYFEGFSEDPNIIYVMADGENNKRGLYTFDVNRKQILDKIAGSDDYDIVDVSFDEDKKLEYYQYYRERPYFVRFDREGQYLDQYFVEKFPGQTVTVENKSRDKKKIIFKVTSPTDPRTYYILDRNDDSFEKIGEIYQKLDKSKLSPMLPITYLARDGLEIPAYLSLPKSEGIEKLPTIIMPHGGPMARDGWQFDYWTQFLNARGYAVLQMNYRGSTGYGEEYRKLGYHEWGRKMLEDINDGTRWMIEQGYADPERICIMGGSYGGYAALQANVKDGSLYKCAVSFAPITSLTGLINTMERNEGFKVYEDYLRSDDWTFDQASPLENIDKINVPILLLHGDRDLNSPIIQSRSFYNKMDKAGKNIKYKIFKDGDHFLSNEEHRIEFLKEVEKFLKQYL